MSSEAHEALLIAVGEYDDPELRQLRSPQADASALRKVLEDPEIGGFKVQELLNKPSHISRREIQRFFANRSLDDLLLVHISCHGVKDDDGRLFFACTDTERELLDATAIPARELNEWMERCRAQRIVVLLDCCYSGAFSAGSKGDRAAHIADNFRGTGRAVLTASNALEYAWEGGHLSTQPVGSVFTTAIISGLRSGEADRNADGLVSVDDLYAHVYEAALNDGRRQNPQKYLYGVSGNLIIAKSTSAQAVPRLSDEVRSGMASAPPEDRIRLSPSRANGASEGEESPDGVLAGIQSVAEMLARTLGPEPRMVLVRSGSEMTSSTDALEIVQEIDATGHLQRVGGNLVKEAVVEVRQQHHDGGATAALIMLTLCRRLDAAVAKGVSAQILRREVAGAVATTRTLLRSFGSVVEHKKQIEGALKTALSDQVIAEMIAEAIDKVGAKGAIVVEQSNTLGLDLVLAEGMRFDEGYISASFVTDTERMEAVLDAPYILIADRKISGITELLPLLEKVIMTGRPLLILAEDVDGEALMTLEINKTNGTFPSVAVRAPGFGSHRRKAMLDDIAILTGGVVIAGDETGNRLDATVLEWLGQARKVIVTKDATTIVEAAGDADQVNGRVQQIRAEIERGESAHDQESLYERLAKLAGGVAIIRIGGTTEADAQDRAIVARRGIALTESIVRFGLAPGGSSVLVRCAARWRGLSEGSESTEVRNAMADALEAPFRQLCTNSGLEDADHIIDSLVHSNVSNGCNVITGRVENLVGQGIWDIVDVQVGAVEAAGRGADKYLSLL